ncbi:MAG: phage virion morphogenesis protein [Sterolibacterium sp.]|nr:phage virion morphogenesis protein [Sterolibacterium sp.]
MTFNIQVSDQAVKAALDRVCNTVTDMQPIMQRIGESIMERTKQRFVSATGPDGTPWASNSEATLMAYLMSRSGNRAAFSNVKTRKQGTTRVGDKKGYFLKDGTLGKKGQDLMMSKRPLHGASGDLARQFHITATSDSVTVSNSMIYAAMQQFGGTKAKFPNLWGDIPARPFLPVTASGELYPQERDLIVAELQRYIQGAVGG